MSPRRQPSVAEQPSLLLDIGGYDHRGGTRPVGMEPFDAATVSLEPGVSLVEASAGTGKTHSITQLVLRLLLARRAAGGYRVRGIGSILVVTFTKAATDELVTRVRSVLREATEVFAGTARPSSTNASLFALRDEFGVGELSRLREALSSLDQLAIFTIHAWCKRVLEESALESGTPFGARFLEDDELLIERMAQDWWRRTIYEDSELAMLAVHSKWGFDSYLKDLDKWQRLPDTRLDPDVALPAARKSLAGAMRQFRQSWNPARAAEFLAERKWFAGGPLTGADSQRETVAAGDRLAAGDVRAAIHISAICCSGSILHPKKGMQKKNAPELREAVATEPFVLASEAVGAALAGMESAMRVSCLQDVAARFAEEKRRRHLLGFDDLLRRLRDSLKEYGSDGQLGHAIRARYDAALIDEFQDTDPFQLTIFETAFTGRPLFLIGDPKQAIFSFRGADLFTYLDAASRAERRYTLGKNWRSTARMVEAVNGLFAHQPSSFLYENIAFSPVTAAREPVDPVAHDGKGALHWWVMPPSDGAKGPAQLFKGEAAARAQAATVAEIVRLLTPVDGRAVLQPGQIAVLVRAGFEGAAMQQALRAVRVPSIVSGMDDILRSRELVELEAVLRAILLPADARGVRGALATELWGANASEIHRLSLPEHESDWQSIIERLTEWRERWVRFGFMRMVQGMLAHLEATERLLGREDGDRRVTNLRHAVELLHTAAFEERLSPEGLLLWIANTRATGEEKAERTELRLETDADAVQIVTIHKSKGLEYDVVFCPTLWATRRTRSDEPVLVHEEADGKQMVVFDHGSPSRTERGRLAAAEELAEELRLVYVALTRARFRCYVAWGAVSNKKSGIHAGHTALGYLLRAEAGTADAATMTELVPTAFVDSLDRFMDPLAALVQANAGCMTMEAIGDGEKLSPWAGSEASVAPPVCRTDLPPAESLKSWRVASFTSLTAGRHSEDARDVADTGGQAEVARITDPASFLDFPAGRLPGVALHEIFELADFAAVPADIRSITVDVLERTGLAKPAQQIDAVTTMVQQVLGTPMSEAGFALASVARSRTLREWAFHLPLGSVDGNVLSRVFAAHGGEVAARYAPALRHLSGERTFGFLTGVVDLAFERDGLWYVVDWKSNHLGMDPASYQPDALEREMAGSHYILQYHLYLTALHRFLRLRVPGYDYETHVGGAWYAFLRGIDGSGRGWFHDRPPKALIDALDTMIGPVADRRAAS